MAPDETEGTVPPDLGLLFSTNAPDVKAGKVFVGRDYERLAFDEAVRLHHVLATSAEFNSQDVLTPRRNVQVFYGPGGVGKTALSRALERRHRNEDCGALVGWPEMQRQFEESIEARIDLASEAGLDLERVLLLIRAAVAKLGHPMHAFDIALSRYWEHVHPDKSIAEFLRGDGVLGRASEALRLSDQIKAGLTEVGVALGLQARWSRSLRISQQPLSRGHADTERNGTSFRTVSVCRPSSKLRLTWRV